MVNRLLGISYHHPRLILLLLIVITAAAAPLLSKIQFDISAQSLIVKNDPAWNTYQRVLEEFGSDNTVILVLSDPQLFTPQVLEHVKQALDQWEALEFVKSSTSLYNVPNVKEVDGYIESKPFLMEFPRSNEAAQTLIDEALANPLVADNLVSHDRQTMAINLSLDDSEHYPGRDSEITGAIERIVLNLQQHVHTVYQMSSPYVLDDISRQIKQDMQTILPLALLVLILVLGVSMGRLNCSIVPLSSAVISIVLTLAFMAHMQIPVNVLNSIIPALLIIIGSTEDVHLMAEYHIGIKNGLTRDQAVMQLPLAQSLAITLAFVTTILGFLSITISNLEMLKQFGWLVAVGLLINFLVTVLFVPAYLRLFGGKAIDLQPDRNMYQKLACAIFALVIRFKKTVLLLLMLVGAYYAWGSQFLQVNNNTLAYFDEHSEINQRANDIHRRLSGMQTFSIVLESSIEGTFKKVRYLNEIESVQQFLQQRGNIDKSFSFADFIKLTHQVMEGISQPQLPIEDEVVEVYMEFVQFEAVEQYINPDYSSARIVVRHNIESSRQLKQEFEAINTFIRTELNSPLTVTLTGDSVLNNNAADAMAVGQIQSLILMMVVILLLISMLFIDFRAGVIALVPNVFPIIVLFGVMGYFAIPLDTGTTMVAVIALGICVDDTIHFLSRYHHYTRGNDNAENALRQTLEHEATPITTTSVALALGFSTLMLSSFKPVAYFGGLSALVMVLAMFSTFVLTPILLSFTRLVTVWDMLSLNLQADVLSNSKFFQGLKYFQIKKAILSGTIRNYMRGDIIIEQGIVGEEFYVLLQGAATATHREKDGSVHTVAYLKAGDLFGEVAELSDHHRSTRVTANERTQVLEMKWSRIQQLGRFHPRIAMRLYQNLASILSNRLVDASDHREQPYDELTGALTRPYLCEILTQEIKRTRYFSEDLSLIQLNIKIVPIREKLESGLEDTVTLAITRVIKEFMRDTDIFARWGKCSFMMVLPRTDKESSLALARDIQMAIESADICTRAHLFIHATVTDLKQGDRREDLLKRLDQQMEQSTHNRKALSISVA